MQIKMTFQILTTYQEKNEYKNYRCKIESAEANKVIHKRQPRTKKENDEDDRK